jgi:hypothetical protein
VPFLDPLEIEALAGPRERILCELRQSRHDLVDIGQRLLHETHDTEVGCMCGEVCIDD